jgi:hypothetical protein
MPYDRILELTTLPGRPNVHLLGVYAKRLTVYSQQTRAVNLVDAIHWYRRPLNNLKVAVVGAGAAGITAAARAIQYGAHITLIERLQNVLEIQNKSSRWLHPTLYEWPFSGLDPAEDVTQLPVMNWPSGTAQSVAETLAEEWKKTYASEASENFNSQVSSIALTDDSSVTLSWRRKTKEGEKEDSDLFDVVIFAVGFGLEPKGVNRSSYWENDSIDKTLRHDECYLIGGYGDGALTDLMRASLNKFDHRALLTSVVKAVSGADFEKVKAIESDRNARNAEYLTARYKDLQIPAVQEILKPNQNTIRRVILSGAGPQLFDPRASALNRLITSQLLHLKGFEHFPIATHERIESADEKDPVFVGLEKRVGRKITDVVLRFGVDRTITKIDGITSAAEQLASDWDKILPADDPTRVRLWDRFTPISSNLDHCCALFLAPASDEEFIADVATRAVEDVAAPQIVEMKTVEVAQCFRSEEALLHTVRALCRAPLAIFPLGKQMGEGDFASMLLLGIRAAVRRSPTLVVHEGNLSAADWSSLPFNLKELQIYALDHTQQKESAARLARAIQDGLAVLQSDAPGYRDLPVFDIVRRPKRRTVNPPEGEREVFVLCSFDKSYDDSWQKLQIWLDGKDDRFGGKLSLKRVIDYPSPLLAGERLYELTRHAGSCLIDWTDWSANVFFEMGVRLAVASTPPICLLRYSNVPLDPVARDLCDRFKPLIYQEPGQTGETFRKNFVSRLAELKPNARPSTPLWSAISRSTTNMEPSLSMSSSLSWWRQ